MSTRSRTFIFAVALLSALSAVASAQTTPKKAESANEKARRHDAEVQEQRDKAKKKLYEDVTKPRQIARDKALKEAAIQHDHDVQQHRNEVKHDEKVQLKDKEERHAVDIRHDQDVQKQRNEIKHDKEVQRARNEDKKKHLPPHG